ncbi:alpha/beta hydrolase [Sulfitobacter guttiformis]|uniref:alpha/beta hydrolase n=1 Tax=Sulfitobacter guttiformis TaxID=74349 RepID=UPI00147438D4|nr:alpha/beta hydrolase-fold protein [Sulfitobacter guttiformis]KIN74218.1 putative esterase [Sulfitobacter guttiformis KCTC 32187]
MAHFWLMGALLMTPAMAEVRFDNALGSETLGRPVAYALYLPPGYDQDKRAYPVLYLLHGGGSGQPSDWFTLAGLDQTLDRMIRDGKIRPLIAIAPDGRRNSANDIATYFLDDHDGQVAWQTMFFEDFIPAVEKRHRAIGGGDARAILGISMGAVAATIYQMQEPNAFAGVSALSSAFRTEEQLLDLSTEGYQSRYAGIIGPDLKGKERLNVAWTELLPESLVDQTDKARFQRIPRLYFEIGSDDPFFEANADLHVVFRDAGIKHRFRVTEGGHDWNFWRTSLEEALLHIDAVLTRGYGE